MELPIGTVLAWGKDLGNPPPGWALCDGGSGRPNVVGRFVMGASSSSDLKEASDVSTHSHTNPNTNERAAHSHAGSLGIGGAEGTVDGYGADPPGTGTRGAAVGHGHGQGSAGIDVVGAGVHSHTVPKTDTKSHMPRYITRAFIIKVS